MSKNNSTNKSIDKEKSNDKKRINNIAQIKIIIIGKTGSGKTSFVNRWVNNTFSEIYKSTIISEYSSKTIKYKNNIYKINLWDIAGQDHFASLIKAFCKDAKGCITMSDIMVPSSLTDAVNWKKNLDENQTLPDGSNIPNILIQNKIDLINEESAKENYNQIKAFVKGTKASKSPVIPISAQYNFNIEAVIYYLCNLPIPKRDFISPPRFVVIRSFDINHPGTEPENLEGGVAGGTLTRGILRLGEVVEIKPGIISKGQKGEHIVQPLYSRIVSLRTEDNYLIYAVPGGLIGVGLKIDPFLTSKDKLKGRILGHPGKLPDIYISIVVKAHLMSRYVGTKSVDKSSSHVGEIKYKEVLLINVGSISIASTAVEISGENRDIIKFSLTPPVCAEIGETVAFSRKLGHCWRLIGWGKVLEGGETI